MLSAHLEQQIVYILQHIPLPTPFPDDLEIDDYDDAVASANLLRSFLQNGWGFLHNDFLPEFNALRSHCTSEVAIAVAQQNWVNAKRWLRPGISLSHTVYDQYEHIPQLNEIIQKGRADAWREAFWNIKQCLRRSNTKARAISILQNTKTQHPLHKTDLYDNTLEEGMPYTIWRIYVMPLLSLRNNSDLTILSAFTRELLLGSPLSSEQALVLCQGLHRRNTQSHLHYLDDELMRIIARGGISSSF